MRCASWTGPWCGLSCPMKPPTKPITILEGLARVAAVVAGRDAVSTARTSPGMLEAAIARVTIEARNGANQDKQAPVTSDDSSRQGDAQKTDDESTDDE